MGLEEERLPVEQHHDIEQGTKLERRVSKDLPGDLNSMRNSKDFNRLLPTKDHRLRTGFDGEGGLHSKGVDGSGDMYKKALDDAFDAWDKANPGKEITRADVKQIIDKAYDSSPKMRAIRDMSLDAIVDYDEWSATEVETKKAHINYSAKIKLEKGGMISKRWLGLGEKLTLPKGNVSKGVIVGGIFAAGIMKANDTYSGTNAMIGDLIGIAETDPNDTNEIRWGIIEASANYQKATGIPFPAAFGVLSTALE